MGFNAVNDDGVVMVTLKLKQDVKKLKKAIKEIGYEASSGYTFAEEGRHG